MDMNEEREGWEIYIIPRQEIKICFGCKYYNREMVKSGQKPIYKNECTHPDTKSSSPFSHYGNLDNNRNTHNRIETPDWCPFFNKADGA